MMKITVLVLVLLGLNSISRVDALCGGCHCNIFVCNCDCALVSECPYPLKNVHAYTTSFTCNRQNQRTDNFYRRRRSVTDESDASQIFSHIDTNQVGFKIFIFLSRLLL